MKNKFENLILLEFMVNKVIFYESEYNIDKEFLCRLRETCVQIKFRGSHIVDIREDENSRTECDENGNRIVYLTSGKSCLLSVGQLMGSSNCEASVCVSRKTPYGEEKEFFILGEAKVNLEPIFKILQSSKCNQAAKTVQGVFDLIDGQYAKAGTIELFVRATDLGKNIVTMFQLGAGESSFYFKGTEQKSEDGLEEEEESSCSVCKDSSLDIGGPCASAPRKMSRTQKQPSIRLPSFPYKEGTTYNQPLAQPPYAQAYPGYQPQFQAPFQPNQQLPPNMQPMAMPQVPGAPYPQPFAPQGAPYPQYRDEDYERLDGDYKEISAEVNGYEVKIRLLRRPKKTAVQQ